MLTPIAVACETSRLAQVECSSATQTRTTHARKGLGSAGLALRLAVLVGAFSVLGCSKPDGATGPKATASADPGAQVAASAHAAVSATKPPPEEPKETDIPAPPDVAAPPADAEKTPTGIASKVLQKGTGKEHPAPTDRVKVNYTGWTKGGRMFDSSIPRGAPITFGLNQVIPGWTQGVALMVVGEKRRLWIPAPLAYGDNPRGGAPAGDLVFDVELLEIIPSPKPPAVPEDVKAPPASAKKTASGIAYRVLKPGTGKTHPSASSRVEVHYSGWTTDGKMFDSSVVRGEPAQFALNQVIPGWTEGVQLMTLGEKTRFWIPGKLAYGDTPSRPGAPAGMLVFDVELLRFE